MISSTKKLIIGNWKMYSYLDSNKNLLEKLINSPITKKIKVGICVPFPYLWHTQNLLIHSNIKWGVQDLSMHKEGPYTGEVSAQMVREFGASFAIIGHSERRIYHNEKYTIITQKILQALSVGIIPILCIGETLEDYKNGKTKYVLSHQLSIILSTLSYSQIKCIKFAYEPIWAIGNNKSADPKEIQNVHSFLKFYLEKYFHISSTVKILYGGSIKPNNASEIFNMTDIDGGLVGKSSLVANEFLEICNAAS